MNDTSYVYFMLSGDDLDPQVITDTLGIISTKSWKKGDAGKHKERTYGAWEFRSSANEYLDINKLVDEVIDKLFDKIELINSVKSTYQLHSILEIVLFIDTNEEVSTPYIGHNNRVIEFLYKTQTETDIDIYRFDSTQRS